MSKTAIEHDSETVAKAVQEMIAASSVVAYCTNEDCGNEIRQAEIDLEVADQRTCAGCVLAYVADMCSW